MDGRRGGLQGPVAAMAGKGRSDNGVRTARSPRRARAGPAPAFENAMPIYVQLIMHFRGQIESGVWPVGVNIPVLEDLAAEFGVARATVRQALGFLEREGLIASHRGRGTMVLRKPQNTLWFPISANWEEMVGRDDIVVGEVLDLRAPTRPPQLPEDGRGTLASDYFTIRRLLKRDAVPYLIGTSQIDRRIIDEVGADALARTSVYRFVDRSRRHRVRFAEQTMTLVSADAETAYLLEIPLNAPIVFILRWLLDQNETLIYQSEGLVRGDLIHVYRRLR